MIFALLMFACRPAKDPDRSSANQPKNGSFAYDLQFLEKVDNPILLQNENGRAQLIVSPKFQGKVFTSTAQGLNGKSFGWINYDLLEKDTIVDHINAHGGENRLWIGPEGGQYSIFFRPGVDMTFENWYTPAPIDTEPWDLLSSTSNEVVMAKDMTLSNYSGTAFQLKVFREVRILPKEDVEDILGIKLEDKVDYVGYRTINTLKNSGLNEWTCESGTLCIWMLDMLVPGDAVTIVIPFQEGSEAELGPIATTNYFGEIPGDRIRFTDDVLFFRADGKHRSKLGIGPRRAKPVLGSYDEENQVLTIAYYSLTEGKKYYVNQLWEFQEEPFSGDVVNAYNDGPLEDGSQMGPFFEIESSSPAAFLKPGEEIIHHHSVFHFVGGEEQLDTIARTVLGVGMEDIKSAFRR